MIQVNVPYGYFDKHMEELTRTVYYHEKDDRIYKLCKIYKDEMIEEYQNFLYLMKFLNTTPLFEELIKPEDIIAYKERSIFYPEERIRSGYSMQSLLKTHETLGERKYDLNIVRLRQILFKIGEILKRINKNKIIYGDLHSHNIMIDELLASIRFIDAECVKVLGINIDDFTQDLVVEKVRLATLVLECLYNGDFSFNVSHKITDKIANLDMSKELREYIEYLSNKENPEEYITDFYSDFETDRIEFNQMALLKSKNIYY